MLHLLQKISPRKKRVIPETAKLPNTSEVICRAEMRQRAESFEAEGDWINAKSYWENLYTGEPNDRRSVIGFTNALIQLKNFDAAEEIIIGAYDKFQQELDFLLNAAICAQHARNYPLAISRFAEAKRHSPEFSYSYAATAAIHISAGDSIMAEQEITEALARFPGDIDIIANSIHISMAREDWQSAQERLTTLEHKFPNHDYTKIMLEDLKKAVISHLKLEAQKATEQALAEQAEKNWPQAIEAWKTCLEYDPQSRLALIFMAKCYENMSEYAQADRALSTALAIYPDNYEVRARYAALPGAFDNWQESSDRWRENLETHPGMIEYSDMAALAFENTGDTESATVLLAKAADMFPDRVNLRMLHAKSAEKMKNWPEAIKSWDLVIKAMPDDMNARNARGDALWHSGFQRSAQSEEEISAEKLPPHKSFSETHNLAKMAEKFESLGDNCELGFVQRILGAEPLGLLRFTAITPETVLGFLHNKFADFGNLETLRLIKTDTEVMLQDSKSRYSFHTFVKSDGLDEEKFLNQQHKRLNFLKREIMHDLSTGEKIFVCKDSYKPISDKILYAISDCLRSYGPNLLLAIRLSDNTHPPGSMILLNEHIMIGHVTKIFKKTPDSMDQIDMNSWKKILSQAIVRQDHLSAQISNRSSK